MPFIETGDGTRLFYKDWGTGEPVLFVHGWVLGADMWEYQMTPLAAQGLRCIAYDVRGAGRSEQPGHGYDPDTLAGDLAAVIQQLDLHQVTLVGHSMGSPQIARYLSRYSADRVARWCLSQPPCRSCARPTTTPTAWMGRRWRRRWRRSARTARSSPPAWRTYGSGTG